MAKIPTSIKHFQIDKANNRMFIIVAAASVITVFSLMSAKALWGQAAYQNRVLNEREKAVKQLEENLKAAEELKTQFDVFASQDPNIIGGVGGTAAKDSDGAKDGDNAKIVLDALPSTYDFPALISSVEKMAKIDNITLQSIAGVDEGRDSETPEPGTTAVTGSEPTPMAFSVTALTDYKHSKRLVQDFEKSIRPIDVTLFSLAGTSNNLTTNIQANTHYQPAVSLKIEQEEVK
jgi:hypothetical protein